MKNSSHCAIRAWQTDPLFQQMDTYWTYAGELKRKTDECSYRKSIFMECSHPDITESKHGYKTNRPEFPG